MSVKVVGELRELKNINTELKRLNAECKNLRLKKREIEDNIKAYLEREKQEGVKYEDIIVLAREKTTHRRLKKKERDEKLLSAINELGVSDSTEALETIKESLRGEEVVVKSLQIQKNRVKNLS
jgi:hypothetical protein